MKKHYQLNYGDIILRPYLKQYIPKYHQWMKDQEILQLTGSEPLSLQQQFQNQESWIKDQRKYTFLIFYKNQDEVKMVGDINLFFSQWIQPNEAQINIMIAQKEYRSKGIATKILNIIQQFASSIYHKDVIIAKIKKNNQPSVKLFKKCGYEFVNYSEHFGQFEYRKKIKKELQYNQFMAKYNLKQINI